MEQTPPVPLVPFVPVMHRERFSELTGIPFGVIDGWVIRGYLPTILLYHLPQPGRRRRRRGYSGGGRAAGFRLAALARRSQSHSSPGRQFAWRGQTTPLRSGAD